VDAGFRPISVELIPRPTPLASGMAAWLRTFAGPLFVQLPEAVRDQALDERSGMTTCDLVEAMRELLERSGIGLGHVLPSARSASLRAVLGAVRRGQQKHGRVVAASAVRVPRSGSESERTREAV
jgi:hypothetical protein